jgi:hypothetical protein
LVEAFVVFDSCEAADRACMLSHNRKLNGRLPEIFRATQEHMQHVLGEAEARAKAAREAAREASRLATIEAARAARAAEKERHRQDALALAASKEAAAKEAREKRAPYALVAGGKENEADGVAGNSGGAAKGKGDESSADGPDATSSDTRAAIISVSEERAEVLTMAPGCGLRPFAFERVFDVQQSQESVYELCGRGAVADFLNGHSGRSFSERLARDATRRPPTEWISLPCGRGWGSLSSRTCKRVVKACTVCRGGRQTAAAGHRQLSAVPPANWTLGSPVFFRAGSVSSLPFRPPPRAANLPPAAASPRH